MDVKVEGKNVQLLGDPMLNNCGPSGSPAKHESKGELKETDKTRADRKQLGNTLSKHN
ncbi:hypothetical protein [Archangium sp.]|uniref:hypothetical protein n=1 Tax=Archangium sp. TaxID=1872627 RepID=UPI002D6E366A|nr:hypothetical protein [Archangium sp.]HYO53837.1 hypothetical protein [Archangium sp.]